MILAPNRSKPGVDIDDDSYDVPGDFLKCLAKVDRAYTSETIDQADESIPLAIRMSATNPHRTASRKTRNVYNANDHKEYLRHASAIIPATNGAFWAVFPAHSTDTSGSDGAVRNSVWYFPKGAAGVSDGIVRGGNSAGCEYVCPDGYKWEPGDSAAPVAPLYMLRRNHPCGATYTNIRMVVSSLDDILSELKLDSIRNDAEKLKTFMSQFGEWSDREGGVGVDILVCCGGYFWDYDPARGGIHFVPSNTLRLYVASRGIVQVLDEEGKNVKETHEASGPHLTETIVIPAHDGGLLKDPSFYPFPVGSTVASVPKQFSGGMMIAGGVYIKDVYPTTYTDRDWAKRENSVKKYEYPAVYMRILATLKCVTVNRPNTNTPGYKYCRIFAIAPTDAIGAAQLEYRAPDAVGMPLNPITKEGVKGLKDEEGAGYFSKNRAPVMYPSVFVRSTGVLQYGGEFYSTEEPPNSPAGLKFPKTGRIMGLNHLMKTIQDADENDTKIVYNVPLLSCHVASLADFGRDMALTWLPMNISGAHGIAEGAVGIPVNTFILLVGGAQTEYTLTVGGISYPYTQENLEKYARDWKDIARITNPEFTAEKIKNITFFGKKVWPSSTPNRPFHLTIDCLRYDCLYSHGVQLGKTDYFVLPTSVLRYEPEPGTHHTNATLIRRKNRTRWDSETAMEMGEIQKHWACNANMYISEVVGMPVIHEGPEKFSEETPYWYGHANPAKGSLGCVNGRNKNEYWLYYLGNGDQPALYHKIQIVSSAKSLCSRGGNRGQTELDAGSGGLEFSNTLPGPGSWGVGTRSGETK